MNEDDKKQVLKFILWINLLVGIWNIYLWNLPDAELFNFLIGCANIGVWTFNRDKLWS